MTRATFTIAAVAFLCAAASSPPVTFESPCSCHDNHGEHRWAVKNDPSTPPTDASAIQAVTPSEVFSWPGPEEHLTQSSERAIAFSRARLIRTKSDSRSAFNCANRAKWVICVSPSNALIAASFRRNRATTRNAKSGFESR